MTGRDPQERGRASTPLELLFDLTFVVAVGQAANQLAHLVEEGHVGAGVIAFAFATFAVTWAWINFSWFASAFDTDDWVFRVVTMVQMVGACIVALGLPDLFHSIDEGGHVDNRIVVAGYVVMRLAMVFNWLRAARQAPELRHTCLTYARAIVVAQVGWIILAIVDLSLWPTLAMVALLNVVEFLGPWLAERSGTPTPWHAHHIAERYSLFAIIALGEGVVGTVTALTSAEDASGGISTDVILVGAAGIGLTFAMWWTYFMLPSGEMLHAKRYLGFGGATATSCSSPPSSRPARVCTSLRSAWTESRTCRRWGRCCLWWSGSDLYDVGVRSLPDPRAARDRLARLAAARHADGARGGGRARGGGPVRAGMPGRRGARPRGDRRGVRDGRPPPRGARRGAAQRRVSPVEG